MVRHRFALAAFAAVAVSLIACSSDHEHEHEHAEEAEAQLCYMADDEHVTSGIVPTAMTCECAQTPIVDEPAPLEPAPEPTLVLAEASFSSPDDFGSQILPTIHGNKGGNCPKDGYCAKAVDWTKVKLKELALCLGIAACAVGGDNPVPKAIVKLAQTVCCATDKKEHEKVSDEIKNQVKVTCGGK